MYVYIYIYIYAYIYIHTPEQHSPLAYTVRSEQQVSTIRMVAVSRKHLTPSPDINSSKSCSEKRYTNTPPSKLPPSADIVTRPSSPANCNNESALLVSV